MKVRLNNTRLFTFLLLTVMVSVAAQGQKRVFRLSGETLKQYSIVLYNDTSVIQQKAAEELSHYLQRIFRVSLPVRRKENIKRDGKYFLLGQGFLRDSLGVTDTLPKDAFVKAFHNGNLYLGGKDDLGVPNVKYAFFKRAEKANFGTLYAVYDFLENNLGVHWFFPTYLGEYVPQKDAYSFEEQIDIIEPAFEQRTFGKTLYFDKDTAMIWMLRNKVTYLGNPTSYRHNWNKILPPEEFFDKYPSVYAEYNGRHREFSRNGRPAQLCTTNEKTIQLFTDQARKYLKSHPKITNFSLSPNDNKDFCNSSNCVKLDTCINISPVYSKMSCRIFTFYRTIYDSLVKYYPDIHYGGYAYKEYAVATGYNILPEKFQIMLAINNIGFGTEKCSTLDTLFLIIQSWKNKPNTGFYCFPYGNTWVYPFLKTDGYKKLIKELIKNNFRKVKWYFYPDWYTQGLDVWLITKMMWAPEINIDSLKKVYYQSVYPESYPVIHYFHNRLQNNVNNLTVCVPNYSLPGIKKTREIFLKLFPDEMLTNTNKQLQKYLTEATLSLKEKENISNFVNMLNFLIKEQQAYSMDRLEKTMMDKTSLLKQKNNILSLKNTLILSGKSLYWNYVKSPSYYIHK